MKIKSTVAGLIAAGAMIVAGGSQAAYGDADAVCAKCGRWDVPFSGPGWEMVPCGTSLPRAVTWQQYTSGPYAPPVTGGGGSLFLGL